MKKTIRFLYLTYHLIFPSPLAACRFRPTCSAYALEVLGKHGIFRGSLLAARRVLSCHPFSKRPFYDPA